MTLKKKDRRKKLKFMAAPPLLTSRRKKNCRTETDENKVILYIWFPAMPFICISLGIFLFSKKPSSYTLSHFKRDKSMNWPFYDRFWSFFCQFTYISSTKTEVLPIILKCLMCLNLTWIKSYDLSNLLTNRFFEYTFVSFEVRQSI